MEENGLDKKAMWEMLAGMSLREERETDFRDEEGMLTCGVCGEKREEMKVVGDGDETFLVKFGRACACEREAIERKKTEDAVRKEQAVVAKLRRASLMDERMSGIRFSKTTVIPKNEKVVNIARRYVAKWGEVFKANQGLMFYGKAGSGKTHLAACIANELLDRGVSVVMTSCSRLADMVLHSDESEAEILGRLNIARLLILDDLGAERNSEYISERVYNIIDARYRSCKPLIVTTNVGIEEFSRDTDATRSRIYSRIKEMCYPVEVNGLEWRAYAANERKKLMDEILGGE